MSDVGDWFNSLPLFTRFWLLFTVCFSMIGKFAFILPSNLELIYVPFVHNFEIWRAVTSVFYFPLSFQFLYNCYFLYNYSLRLERGEYDGRPADYLFMLLFNWVCCVVASLLIGFPLLMEPMVLSVLYVWCQLNKYVIVHFLFGTQFKAMYLPWILLLFNFVAYGSWVIEVVGILVGHVYFFFKFKYPQEFGGPDLLSTPQFLEKYLPPQRGIRGFGTAPSQRTAGLHAQPQARNVFAHNWGRGQVLGQ